MSNDRDTDGMSLDDVIAHLESGVERAEEGEIPRFSERYAMREAAKRLAEAREILAKIGAGDPASWLIAQETGETVTMSAIVPGGVLREAQAWLNER